MIMHNSITVLLNTFVSLLSSSCPSVLSLSLEMGMGYIAEAMLGKKGTCNSNPVPSKSWLDGPW